MSNSPVPPEWSSRTTNTFKAPSVSQHYSSRLSLFSSFFSFPNRLIFNHVYCVCGGTCTLNSSALRDLPGVGDTGVCEPHNVDAANWTTVFSINTTLSYSLSPFLQPLQSLCVWSVCVHACIVSMCAVWYVLICGTHVPVFRDVYTVCIHSEMTENIGSSVLSVLVFFICDRVSHWT